MKNTKFNLWHYTTLDGLKGILSSQTLWATDYRHLNDSSELFYSKSIICQEVLPRVCSIIESECKKNPSAQKVVEAHGGVMNIAKMETEETIDILFSSLLNSPTLPQIPFVLSFCKASEEDIFLQENGLLSQWRGYGKDGGYAIIFDIGKIIDEFTKESNSFYYGISTHGDIVYEPDKLTINDTMSKNLEIISNHVYRVYRFVLYREPLSPASTVKELSSLFYCMTLLKQKGFKEETEYRFCAMPYSKEAKHNQYFVEDKSKSFKEIITRNGRGTLVPYIKLFERSNKLPIKKVCVGPHHDKKLRAESMSMYLHSIGLDNIEVVCSGTPYIGLK